LPVSKSNTEEPHHWQFVIITQRNTIVGSLFIKHKGTPLLAVFYQTQRSTTAGILFIQYRGTPSQTVC